MGEVPLSLSIQDASIDIQYDPSGSRHGYDSIFFLFDSIQSQKIFILTELMTTHDDSTFHSIPLGIFVKNEVCLFYFKLSEKVVRQPFFNKPHDLEKAHIIFGHSEAKF